MTKLSALLLLSLLIVAASFTPNNRPPRSSWRSAVPDDGDPGPINSLIFPPVQGFSLVDEESGQSRVRGGGSGTDVVSGTKATLASTSSYWKGAFTSAQKTLSKPFSAARNKIKAIFKSKEQKQQEELLEKLETMNVLRVAIEGESIIPQEVLYLTAKRTGVLNRPLANKNIQKFAEQIKKWYDRKGYLLHRVTGATLDADTATAIIQVQEPKVAAVPVDITFCKEMVVDENGEVLTFRKYKERHETRRTFGFGKLSRDDLNTTFVPSDGKTRSSRVAKALSLKPGESFRWDASRWGSVARSGVFKNVLRASPQGMSDGTVQFNILATESPSRHLEYGVAKSLYTGSWEGEVEFEHINLLGGGEKLGLNVRRGAKDAEPSVMISFNDDHFGLEGGYDVEVFRDFIGNDPSTVVVETGESVVDKDDLLDRKGATLRLHNPIDTRQIQHSVASGSFERIATKTGFRESIGSASLSVGPFDGELSLGARWNVDAKCTLGTRIKDRKSEKDALQYTPYAAITSTTRQILPLLSNIGRSQRSLVLALQHSMTASTPTIPRHEAKAQGIANKIRGLEPFARAVTAVRGTTEIRIPLDLPIGIVQDSNVVLFGDWVFAAPDFKSAFAKQTCVGIGFRKAFQGIPLKFDLSYGADGKIRNNFGLGADFSV